MAPKRTAPSLALEVAARPLPSLVVRRAAERALGRAAVALWKAERRRGTARG